MRTRIGRSGGRGGATGGKTDAITILLIDPAADSPQPPNEMVGFWNSTSFTGALPGVHYPTIGQQIQAPMGDRDQHA